MIAAVLYAAIASGSIMTIGRSFVQVSEDKNQAEAEYRYALTRVRENGESIALLGGEEEERDGIDKTFTKVLRQWARLAGQHMRTTLVSQGSSLIAPVVPLLLCAPKFLDGSMTLGQVMQAASAFTIVQTAFGWLVDNYPRLADWNACARRIASLMMSLDGLERAERGDGIGRIKRGETEGEAMLSLNDLSVTLDDGTAVVGETEVVIEPGERLLVAGESGTGKSTLVRAIAGLWPWGGGSVNFHPDRRLFMLPQKPYVPSGTLRRAVAYPGAAEDWTRRGDRRSPATRSASTISRRRSRKTRRGTRRCPAARSSGWPSRGCLLHNPDIVVLDEATSALDEKSQDKMMEMVNRELPKATIVSVAHRAELEAFHSRKIVLERRKGGAKLVSDIDLIPRKGKRRLLGRFLRHRKRREEGGVSACVLAVVPAAWSAATSGAQLRRTLRIRVRQDARAAAYRSRLTRRRTGRRSSCWHRRKTGYACAASTRGHPFETRQRSHRPRRSARSRRTPRRLRSSRWRSARG